MTVSIGNFFLIFFVPGVTFFIFIIQIKFFLTIKRLLKNIFALICTLVFNGIEMSKLRTENEIEIKEYQCVKYKLWKSENFLESYLNQTSINSEIKSFVCDNRKLIKTEYYDKNFSVDSVEKVKNELGKEEIIVTIIVSTEFLKADVNFKWPQYLLGFKLDRRDGYCLTLINEGKPHVNKFTKKPK